MKFHPLLLLGAYVAYTCGQTAWDICSQGPCECNELGKSVSCIQVPFTTIEESQVYPPDTEHLTFWNNSMVTLPAEFFVFKNIANVQSIWFNHNSLTALSRSSFRFASGVTQLHIWNSQIETLPSDVLAELRDLEEFELEVNPLLTSIPESLFLGLDKLDRFLVFDSPVTSIPPRLFFSPTKPSSVQFHHTDLNTIPANVFDRSTAIKTVNFDQSRGGLTVISSDWFEGLTGVETLIIRNHREIRTIQQNAFDGLPNLRYLHLTGNNFTVAGIPETIFDKLVPAFVYLGNNPLISAQPVACSKEGITCTI